MRAFRTFSWLLFASLLPAQTNIAIGTTALQTGVKRLGINLDAHNYYDRQILKNLTMTNPGFSPTLYRSTVACASGSSTTCVDASSYNGWTTGFWPAGSTVEVISGAASGCNTTLSSYTGPSGGAGGTYTFATACPGALAAGDWLIIGQTIGPGRSANTATALAEWWPTVSGNGSNAIQPADVPPATSSVQALEMKAPSAGDVASISEYFDSEAGHSFINLNGSFQIQFAAKAKSGSQIVNVAFSRGGNYYLNSTPVSLTGSWANYTVNFNAFETGSQSGQCQLTFSTSGVDDILLDNVQLIQMGTSSSNPTVFRDAVVSTLQLLKPGVIRMWDGEGLGNTLDNMLIDQFGRSPTNYTAYPQAAPGQYAYNPSSYSIPEFLQLVQTVGNGAEAWIVLPITFSATEAANLIDYLSGGAKTTYGAKRIAEGFAAPWTQVIPKIHLEFGNEAWNSTFQGGSLNNFASVTTGNTVYARRAQTIFAAMKGNANYDAKHTLLVVGAQFSNANTVQTIQNNCNNNDEMSVAPYMMNGPTNAASTAAIWGPALTEPQAYYSHKPGVAAENIGTATVSQNYFAANGTTGTQYGGGMYLDLLAEANSNNPKPVAIYEENFSTTGGSYTQAQLNAYTSAWGAGLATVEEELLGIQNGVLTQNLFTLDQYQVKTTIGSETAYLWGSVIDMGGPTNRRRPQFLAAQVANSAIAPGATMLQTTQTGTPTYTQALMNSVALTNSNLVQSFAFSNGSGNYGLILLNTGVTGSQAVTLSGPNAPANGSMVIQTVLTSANLGDTNEAGNVIAPVTTVLNGFNPAAGITLAPYSETVLTWGPTSVAPAGVSLSPASLSFTSTEVGKSSAAQTVVLSNTTTSALGIYNIALTGPDFREFSQTNTCGKQLAASSTCNIAVTFAPAAGGPKSAILSVADGATGSPQTAALSGTGVSASVASYYVSNSGDDTNPGTSSGSPWRTIAKVNAQALSPGTTVLFQAGGRWREQLIANASGTAGHPITYGSYGQGAAPIIDAANLTNWKNVSGKIWSTPATANPLFPNFGGIPGIQKASQAALTAADEWYWDGWSTLYIYSPANPAATVEIPAREYAFYSNAGVNYVTVQNLEMRGARSYGLQCYSATTGCSNWVLTGNTMDLNYSNGAYFLTGTAGDQSRNGLAQNNTLKNNGSSGLKIGGYWASWNVTGNQVYGNCLEVGAGTENSFCGGIYVYSASGLDGTGSTIAKNTVYNNGLPAQANSSYGQGIWTDTTNGVTIANNVAYGNRSNGIYLEKTTNGVAYRNLGYSNGAVTYTGCLTLAAGQGHNSSGNLIYENTCSGGYWTLGLNFEDANGLMSNNSIQNNIFLNSSRPVLYGAEQVNNTTNGSGNVFTRNSFGVAYSNFICWVSACQSSYAAFERAYGRTSDSLQKSPDLVGPEKHNFNLSASSPARGFGLPHPGFPAPCGGNPDLGALPYACASKE